MASNEEIRGMLDKLSENVVKLLCIKMLKISTAESCTGGMLAQYITSVSGASDIFEYGICSYSERIKMQELGVSYESLVKYGVVSESVAKQMALGVSRKSGSDIGVGITGIAGPTGFTKQQPVGTVYVAVSYKDRILCRDLMLYKQDNELDRQKVRLLTTYESFKMIQDIIE